MLMSRSLPQPRSRKTPRGGRRMAMMILKISLDVKSQQRIALEKISSHAPKIESYGRAIATSKDVMLRVTYEAVKGILD
jgi:hypothetical protein